MGLQCKVWCGIALSVFTTVCLGLEIAFNVYAISLKRTFNLTQTQVELISSSGLAGMGFSLSESFVTGKFGYKVGYSFILLSTSLSTLMMWLTTVYVDVYTNWFGIVAVITFLMSFSQNAGSTRLAAITLTSVPKQHTGKVVGLYSACIASAKLVYSSVFLLVFNENLKNFFLAVSVIFALLIGLCFLLHRPVDGTFDIKTPVEQKLIPPKAQKEDTNADQDRYRFGDVLPSRDFHMIFWPSVIHYAIMFSLMNNVSFIAYSVGVDVPMHLIYVLSITIVLGRLTFGLLFDRIGSYRCGFALLLCGSFSSVVSNCMSTFALNQNTIYLITILLGVGISCGITMPTSLLSVRFGQNNFSFILGSYYCMTAAFCLIFQTIIGVVYDLRIKADGFCYGLHCFQISLGTLLVVSGCCFTMQIVTFVLQTVTK